MVITLEGNVYGWGSPNFGIYIKNFLKFYFFKTNFNKYYIKKFLGKLGISEKKM